MSREREATTRGAGLMALVGAGHLAPSDVEQLWEPLEVFLPELGNEQRSHGRDTWSAMVARVEKTIPDLSTVQFCARATTYSDQGARWRASSSVVRSSSNTLVSISARGWLSDTTPLSTPSLE